MCDKQVVRAPLRVWIAEVELKDCIREEIFTNEEDAWSWTEEWNETGEMISCNVVEQWIEWNGTNWSVKEA